MVKHYETIAGPEHWDFVVSRMANRYLEGNASKYICRWRKKGGVADLIKARNYIGKLHDEWQAGTIQPPFKPIPTDVVELAHAYRLSPYEVSVILLLCTWRHGEDLRMAFNILDDFYRQCAVHLQDVAARPEWYKTHRTTFWGWDPRSKEDQKADCEHDCALRGQTS
jgi:hypothetical protein